MQRAMPSRRAVLAASAVALPLLVTGCKGVQVLGTPPPPPVDVTVLRAAIRAEEVMVASYTAALTAGSGSPTVQAALADVLAQHRQHLSQLKARLVEPGADAAVRQPPVRALVLPASLAGTLHVLESAELSASDRLVADLPALPPALAQLFASIAASEATHAPFLTASFARAGRVAR